MADLGGLRRALREAVSELGPIVAADKPATLDAIARALHALCRAQLAMLSREVDGSTAGADSLTGLFAAAAATASTAVPPGAAPVPIPPERLMDEEDEPTVFLAGAEPLGDDGDDDAGAPRDDAPTPPPFIAPAVPGSDAVAASGAHSRLALERFELDAINRWLSSGTLFQMRGDLAYLNLASSLRIGFDFRLKLREMGFSRELGLLGAAPLDGPVLLFQRP